MKFGPETYLAKPESGKEKMRNKKILFFIPSLTNSAGMERISTDLANLLCNEGYECMFAVLEGEGPFFPLHESVRVYDLDCPGGIRSARFRAARRLRKTLKDIRPDILLNVDISMIQVSALAFPAQLGIRMITWEQFSMASTTSFFARLQRYFASLCSSKLIVLTHADREAYPFLLRPKIAVIHNFTRLNEQDMQADLNHKTVLSVGRLCPTKGFDLLLKAWETVHRQCPEWKLRIVGGGEDEEALRRRIMDADMECSVSLVPPIRNIEKEYLGASVYVLSSRYEPFGLVIVEAKSFGLPVVSFDCPYGPREIIRNGIDGVLVKNEDVQGLAEALINLLQDAGLREIYGKAATQDYKQRWRSKNAISTWGAYSQLTKRATYTAAVLFLISPAFSLPLIIHNIYKGNLKVLTLLALFMSLCAIITPPFADLYNHSQMYYEYQSNLTDDSIIQRNGSDYVLYTLSHFFAKNGIHFELIRGLFVFICYQISFILYKSLVKMKSELLNNPKLNFSIFLCFFLSVPFIWIVSGLRSATSSYLMVYAWYLLTNRKIFWCTICALIGVWTHFFSLIFVPFLLLYALPRLHVSHLLFIGLFVLCLISGGVLLSETIYNFSEETFGNMGPDQNVIDLYVGGGLTYEDLSINGLIALILERLPMIILILINVFRSNFWCNKKEQTFVYLLILLTGLCGFFLILFQRISWLVYPIMLYLMLKNFIYGQQHKYIYLTFLATILLQFAYIYGYREIISNTPFYLLFFPAVIAFCHTYPSYYVIKI